MFRLTRLRPPNGWSSVWWELLIVTIGVLIALWAEQFVSDMNARSQLSEFRKAANEEIATNLWAYRFRISQSPCIARRIEELESWRDDALASGGITPSVTGEISRPSLYTFRNATWGSRGNVVDHMALEERLNYAEVYAVIEGNSRTMMEERDAWRSLAAFNALPRLTPESAMRLNALLYLVRNLDQNIRLNYEQALDFGRRVKVSPDPGRRKRYLRPADPRFCQPFLNKSGD